MSKWVRLSEHPLAQAWSSQFRTSYDRARASQLLNQLKLISGRQFETAIEQTLTTLQQRLNSTIAVYPIAPPLPDEIVGYDPFIGGIPKTHDDPITPVRRRRHYGSEDRVGHLLAKLQDRHRERSSVSRIECSPTMIQLTTQGIRHIVLVDDVCSSGQRIKSYWKSMPRRIKSLLSYKKLELWIVLFAITPTGRISIQNALPNFPADSHLITAMPEADLRELPPELLDLCDEYATILEMDEMSVGYQGSACPIVFEHGCPNGVPAILWANRHAWRGLFPNRSIPDAIRPFFDGNGGDRIVEALWRAKQRRMALSVLDALDRRVAMEPDDWLLMSLLALRMTGMAESTIAKRALISRTRCKFLLARADEMGLYDAAARQVTILGKECIDRFRASCGKGRSASGIARDPLTYYPMQCEGKVRSPG